MVFIIFQDVKTDKDFITVLLSISTCINCAVFFYIFWD